MIQRAFALTAILAALSFGPRATTATEVGPEDLIAASKAVWLASGKVGLATMKPFRSARDLRLDLARRFRSLFPWDDYYAQRGRAFSGTVRIDTASGLIQASIRVDVRILGEGHQSLYFLTFLPVLSVTTLQGDPVEFDEISQYGVKFTRLKLLEPPPDGAEMTFVFNMEGTPICEFSQAFTVLLCAFGDITYLAMDLFLPGSLMIDFATLDLFVTVPSGLTVASSGITVDVMPDATEGYEVHHIVQDFPTDSHSMAISKYQESHIPFGDGRVGTYTRPDSLVQGIVPKVLSDMRDILAFYSDHYGPFAFPKMEAAQITDDAGAAFGWPALLWVPDSMFLIGAGSHPHGFWSEDERTALFAHELGHQWFPDMLKNDDAWGAWLSEGFAEFSSLYFMASVKGDSYMQGALESYSMLYRYFVSPDKDYGLTSKESQYVSDPFVYQIVTYYKGAVVTNMLRKVLGEQTFLSAIRKLYDDYALKEAWYDTATLQKYLEGEYGGSLKWFFDPWVYGKGYPIYTVDVTRLGPSQTQGDSPRSRVRVRVTRTSSIEGTKFDGPMVFTLVTDKGEESHTEWIDKDDQTFEWEHEGRLFKVRFDPDRTYIKRVIPGLPGDMDLSGEIDGIDLIYTAWAYGSKVGQSYNFLPYVDYDGNGAVDQADLELVKSGFGKTSGEVEE